jgi:hypothetical protein
MASLEMITEDSVGLDGKPARVIAFRDSKMYATGRDSKIEKLM